MSALQSVFFLMQKPVLQCRVQKSETAGSEESEAHKTGVPAASRLHPSGLAKVRNALSLP